MQTNITNLYKGSVKTILLLIGMVCFVVISAITFGYDNQQIQNAKNDVQDMTQEVIQNNGVEIVTNILENGQQTVGKTLKKTGEKILKEDKQMGFYGFYDENKISKYAKVILFFQADGCSHCTEIDNMIKKNRSQIPVNVAIMKVDFDDEKKLYELHDVDKQNIFILIDNKGNEIKRWQDSKTFNEILNNIN